MSEKSEIIAQISRLEKSSRRTLPFLAIGLVSVILALSFAAAQLAKTQREIAEANTRKEQVIQAAADAELRLSQLRAEIELVNKDLQTAVMPAITPESLIAALGEATSRTRSIQLSIGQAEVALREATSSASLKPRVYFHIRSEEQRVRAAALAKSLTQAGAVIVPGIHLVSRGPSKTELRYFRKAEKSEAEAIAAALQAEGLLVDIKLIPGYEDSTAIRPRHFELWLAAG